jgi:hypothetical protein
MYYLIFLLPLLYLSCSAPKESDEGSTSQNNSSTNQTTINTTPAPQDNTDTTPLASTQLDEATISTIQSLSSGETSINSNIDNFITLDKAGAIDLQAYYQPRDILSRRKAHFQNANLFVADETLFYFDNQVLAADANDLIVEQVTVFDDYILLGEGNSSSTIKRFVDKQETLLHTKQQPNKSTILETTCKLLDIHTEFKLSHLPPLQHSKTSYFDVIEVRCNYTATQTHELINEPYRQSSYFDIYYARDIGFIAKYEKLCYQLVPLLVNNQELSIPLYSSDKSTCRSEEDFYDYILSVTY